MASVQAIPATLPLLSSFQKLELQPSDRKTNIDDAEKQATEQWLYRFTEEDVKLVNKAYEHFESLSVSNNEITQKTFPIAADSTLCRVLNETTQELNSGLGFRVLRGLPVGSWTRAKQISVFAGLSSYVNPKRIANNGSNIVHLRDITNVEADKRPAISVKGQTNGNQVFHQDGFVGIIALLTLGIAETGGLSQLSSVGQTYNELASTRRDIIRELAKPDWKNKYQTQGRPLIHPVGKDQVVSVYSRRPYFGFFGVDQDNEPLPENKHLALDAIHFTAEKSSLDLTLEKGDLEYVNNIVVYHARTSSEDSEKNQRHLIRLWLDNEPQELPESLVADFRTPREGDRWPQEAWD
ncbi:uncharacterized protein IL334_007443 [Kwoniella shivajii]|uniref:TauD/TfdA-like domain-containing protein n=1 Tax=Kwoniella shivajii TaxID=564305 RepID=A0ABZ1DAT5_9TREE|nr:hypothetical protein IL334_007443 [Kwoniella shivajii]